LLKPGFIGFKPVFSFLFFLNFSSNLSLKFVCQCLFQAALVSVSEASFSQFNQGGKKEVHVTEVHEVRPFG